MSKETRECPQTPRGQHTFRTDEPHFYRKQPVKRPTAVCEMWDQERFESASAPDFNSVRRHHSMSTCVSPSSAAPTAPLKKRLISRSELLRHSTRSLVRLLSSSSVLEGSLGTPSSPSLAGSSELPAAQDGITLLYTTGGSSRADQRTSFIGWVRAFGRRVQIARLRCRVGEALVALQRGWRSLDRSSGTTDEEGVCTRPADKRVSSVFARSSQAVGFHERVCFFRVWSRRQSVCLTAVSRQTSDPRS